jgi:hypothetical protein
MSTKDYQFLNENYVHFIFKNKKSENDSYNQIREKVIHLFLCYFEKGIPRDNQCYELFQQFKQTLVDYGVENILKYDKKGGRNTFDFVLTCLINQKEQEIVLEFKNNSEKVEDLPEFLQLYTNNKETKITKNEYHRYYYDHYLAKILEFIKEKYNKKIDLPSYKDYLKDINNTNKNKKTFHQIIKKFYKRNPKEMNEIVKESIGKFLEKERIFEIGNFNQKLKGQENKLFLLHKEGKFYLDQIKDHMKIEKFKDIKNNNTIIFDTTTKAEIHCLLRWKNGNGCIGPAWQIKLCFPEMKKETKRTNTGTTMRTNQTTQITIPTLSIEKLKESVGRKGYSIKELVEFCKMMNLNCKNAKKDVLVSRLLSQ